MCHAPIEPKRISCSMKFWNVTPPLRTHVPGPAPAGGGALNVSGSQASIRFTITLPEAFIRWLTVFATSSAGFAAMLDGVVGVDDVWDRLPGPQPNSKQYQRNNEETKRHRCAPFDAASRNSIAVLAQEGHARFRVVDRTLW
jgi:hypothetical protein